MIERFISNCKFNQDKDAFRYLKNGKVKTIKFNQLLVDVYNFCNFFQSKGLKQNDKVVVFIMPSYQVYSLMIAGLMYGLNIIVIDSFKDLNKVDLMVKLSRAEYVFVNKKTSFLSRFIFKSLKRINVSRVNNNVCREFKYQVNSNDIVLTTFTSGTTGNPKIINRRFQDLDKQVTILKNNIEIDNNDVVVCMLPIYVLFSLFNGNTTVFLKKINQNNVDLVKADIILGKISNILNIKEEIKRIKKVYFGGAYIYKNEARKIISCFNNASINYIYGASEGVLIGFNTLDDFYKNNRFKKVLGINIEIVDKVDSVGEIVINGESVLSNNLTHKTGDIGYCDAEYLYLVGRKKYSSLENKFYNYLYDQKIREKYNLYKVFSLWYNNKIYVFYSGNCSNKEFIKVKKFKYDLKHKTKVDYSSLIEEYLK